MDKIVMLLSFIARGKSREYLELLQGENIKLHFQTVGQGTAPTELMDIFGLGTNDKDVMVSYAPRRSAERLSQKLIDRVDHSSTHWGGIMMLIPLSAVNRLTSEILNRADRDFTHKGESKMDNETKHTLIFITVNAGYTEEVMQCARRVGATGGTVMRARLAGSEKLEMLEGREIQEEKEIISILASENIAVAVMNEINAHFGLKTDASGTVVAVPVDKAFKI